MEEDWVPKKQIESVLNSEFVAPFIDSISQDPEISLKLSSAFVLLGLSEQLIIEFDNNEAKSGKAARIA